MGHASVLREITAVDVSTNARTIVKAVLTTTRVQSVLLADSDICVLLRATVTAFRVISRPVSALNNLHVRHRALRVLTLERALPASQVTSEVTVVRHVQVVVMADVRLTQGPAMPVRLDGLDLSVNNSANVATILVVVKTEPVTNVRIQTHMV